MQGLMISHLWSGNWFEMNRRIYTDFIEDVNELAMKYGYGELGLTMLLVVAAFFSAKKMMEDNPEESRSFVSKGMVPYSVPEAF